MDFDYYKYHGLGNDYLVMDPGRFRQPLSGEAIAAICDRHRGVGGDGILLGPLPPGEGITVPEGETAHRVRIFNPDGGEGEKSGNGLRIFARYLWEHRLVPGPEFTLLTLGGPTRARIIDPDGSRIAVEMGPVRFGSADIPVTGPEREVLRETLSAGGREFTVSAATVGNPHCVVEVDAPTPELAREFGPHIENHPWFPNRANVQFMAVTGPHRVRIEIWERGAGYTLASGTSSCAASAVACRLGLASSPVTVEMAGGELDIRLDHAFHAELEGPVQAVGAGRLADEFLSSLGLSRI